MSAVLKAIVVTSVALLLLTSCASSSSDPATGVPHGRLGAYIDQNPIPVRQSRNRAIGLGVYEITFKVIVRNSGLIPVELRMIQVELVDASRGVVSRQTLEPDQMTGISGLTGLGTIEPGSSAKIPLDLSELVNDVRLLSRASVNVSIEGIDEAGQTLTAGATASLATWPGD